MRIRLKGGDLERYLEIRRNKMKFQMPDKRKPRSRIRIRVCHLTRRQRQKFAEIMLEGFR